MSNRASIEMDFKQAQAQAKRLEELAEQMTTIAEKRMKYSLEKIAGNWEGENANNYLRKGDREKEEIKETAGCLYGIAKDIRAIAQKIYEAEMKALKRARKKHSK